MRLLTRALQNQQVASFVLHLLHTAARLLLTFPVVKPVVAAVLRHLNLHDRLKLLYFRLARPVTCEPNACPYGKVPESATDLNPTEIRIHHDLILRLNRPGH